MNVRGKERERERESEREKESEWLRNSEQTTYLNGVHLSW